MTNTVTTITATVATIVYSVPSTVLSTLHALSHLLITIPWIRYWFCRWGNWGSVTYQRTHSSRIEFEIRNSDSKLQALNHQNIRFLRSLINIKAILSEVTETVLVSSVSFFLEETISKAVCLKLATTYVLDWIILCCGVLFCELQDV